MKERWEREREREREKRGGEGGGIPLASKKSSFISRGELGFFFKKIVFIFFCFCCC